MQKRPTRYDEENMNAVVDIIYPDVVKWLDESEKNEKEI
jgi:hypothetical protein